MKAIKIPAKVRNTFLFKTRELIFTLNQNLETYDFEIDHEAVAYLTALSNIPDVGKRYEVMMRAFADTLCE